MRVMIRRRFLELALAQASLLGVGCGTIMYPERRGQPGGSLDWRVVALDAAGLLLFFIPGIIAFAVDFSNGTIYLPPEGQALHSHSHSDGERKFVTVKLLEGPITTEKLATIVSQHTQREVQLTPGTYRTEELEKIDDFWAAWDKQEGDREPG